MIKIFNNDCFEIMNKLIEEGVKVDMILTDPPYAKTKNKWDCAIPMNEYAEVEIGAKVVNMNFEEYLIHYIKKGLYYDVIIRMWNEDKKYGMWDKLNKLIKDDGAVVLFGQGSFSSKLMKSNEKMHRYNLVWDKQLPSGFLNAKRMPLPSHEDIIVFYKKLPTYNPQKFKGKKNNGNGKLNKNYKNNNYGDFEQVDNRDNLGDMKFPRSILSFQKPHPSTCVHPTQKPVELLEYLIKTYTNKGDIVLDFTMGSGSTGVACKNINRKFIGIELDKHYFDIAERRILSEKSN